MNVHYRWDIANRPVLSIQPGDEVVVETRSGEDDQLRPGDPPRAVLELDRSRIHALTGPIYVQGAEPGDCLVVRVLEVKPRPWGFTLQRPCAGLLDGDIKPYLRFFELDIDRAKTVFDNGIEIELAPFLGVMGVVPTSGQMSTVPPGPHGGNLDCRALVAGSILYLPVFHPGALFSCGDGHAAQGDGEVCVTAIECGTTSRLRFDVIKGAGLGDPEAETPDLFMTLAAGTSLEEAAKQALTSLLHRICNCTNLAWEDAYALASIAADLRVNQVVNRPMVGVRAVLPKSVLPLSVSR